MSSLAPAPSLPTADTLAELRTLIRLAAPIALAQVGLVAMSLVDTAILGRVSVDDLAGTAMGSAIAFAAGTPAIGSAMALEPLASQAVGARESRRAWSALLATLRATVLVVAPCLVLGYLAVVALESLGVAHSVAMRARANYLGRAPGAVLFGLFLVGKTFLQAHGKTRPALVASVSANALNFVVCSLLVRGDDALHSVGLAAIGLPRMGALGAGLATSFASLWLTAVVLHAAWRFRPDAVAGEHGDSVFRRARVGPAPEARDTVTVSRVFALGLPVGLQLLAEVGVFSFVAVLAGRFGAYAVSAHQIALGMASFTFMGALGVSGATAVRVGHAIGQGHSPRRAGLLGIALGAAVMSLGATVFALFPDALMTVFTSDPSVREVGARLLRIAALFQLFDGVQAVASGALRGAGDVRFPFVATVIAHWFVGLPIALALGFVAGLGVQGFWWGLTAGLVAAAVMLGTRFAVLSRRAIARL